MITFDAWYRNFPKKCAKKDAEKAWNGLTEEQHDAAAAALPNHVLYWHAHGTEMHYIPLPATWLRGWRWEDVLIFERRQTARPETPQEHRANNVATLTGRRHETISRVGNAEQVDVQNSTDSSTVRKICG